MRNRTFPILIRIFFIFLSICLIGYVIFFNLAPYGKIEKLSLDSPINPLILGPNERISVEDVQNTKIYQINSNVVYFTTKMDYRYDRAHIKLTFKNETEDQPIYLGFQTQEGYHYEDKLADIPFLNSLSNQGWTFTGENPTLYQKTQKYNSYNDFLNDQHLNEIVGVYAFDRNLFPQTYIGDYTPLDTNTIIDTPIRGNFTFYTYLNNEPFKLKIWKQDLNFYADPDPLLINIYKEKDLVYSAQIDDDGVIESSGNSMPAQSAFIENPGPGLPEQGVYKINIKGNSDTVVTKMETNLHKIVFDSPLFLVSNSQVYPNLIKESSANILYSDALVYSASTYHPEALQDIVINDQILRLSEVKTEEATPSSTSPAKITLPKSDIIINGLLGHFAFSQDQLFSPTKYKVFPVQNKEDAEVVDHIVANYRPNQDTNPWRTSETDFDLKNSFTNKNKLSWEIKIPGIKENQNKVWIKQIEVSLIKDPILK